MANVISSFLVGIGFDYDRKSADQIGTGIDSIKSKALQLGSVVAGAFGIKALTFDFAQSKDMLGKFSEVFGVTANDVQALGRALETEGGSLESLMSQLEELERRRARIRIGDVAFFAPAGKAGINPNDVANAKDAVEAYKIIAEQMKGMNRQEIINVAEAFGFDEASIRLMSQGRGGIDALIAKYQKIQPLTKDMTNSAAEFNRSWVELKANVGGVADVISSDLLPVINDITKSINSWFGDDRKGKVSAVSAWAKLLFGDISVKDASESTGMPEWMLTNPLDLLNKMTDRQTYDAWYKNRTNSGNGTDIPMGADPSLIMDSQSPQKYDFIPEKKGDIEKGSAREKLDEWYKSRDTPPSTQTIDISLNLDGTVLDRRTVKVVNGIAQTAIDDLTSSTVA